MNIPTITIKEYLKEKGIEFKESNGELITRCLFNNCDIDSRPNEAHLYFSSETGQYDCKKCGEQGNIFTLAKFFGDDPKEVILESNTTTNTQNSENNYSPITFDTSIIDKCHKRLPDHIRQYLNNRGITNHLINFYQLGYGKFYGCYWITIPIKDKNGQYIFLKLRRDPNDSINPDKYKFYPKGSEATLFGIDSVQDITNELFICEGEFDQMVLTDLFTPSVSSTAGAKTFKDEWLKDLQPSIKKFVISYDNDPEGETGTYDVIGKIRKYFPLADICKIDLSKKVGAGEDISDFFYKYHYGLDEYFNLAKKIETFTTFKERIAKVPKPEQEFSFEQWRKTIHDNFPELVFPAEISLSVLSQLLIMDITNPFSLVLVDVPSAGKTIAINFFDHIKELTYATDKFSPASFVSNAANVKKEKLPEVDLLPRLKYKMFLIRDLATLFSKRDEDLKELLGLLTRILDGEGLNTDTGVHGQRQYEGEYLFMVLAASTPIPPRVWKIMGNLGSRLFFLNLDSKDKSEEELAKQLSNTAYKEKERICQLTTKYFAYSLWNKYKNGVAWDRTKDAQEHKIIIARCAKLLARLRAAVNVWYSEEGSSYSYTVPIIERPDRINQLFYNLSRGHALITGRQYINKEDLKIVVELAMHSAPTTRSKIFRLLLDNNGVITTSQVEVALMCSKPTALKEIETLRILGLGYFIGESQDYAGHPEKTLKLNSTFDWFLSEECQEIRGISLPPKQSIMSF